LQYFITSTINRKIQLSRAIKLVLILVFCCTFWAYPIFSQLPVGFRTFTYTTENGLPSNGLKGMQWDESSGFLWIATEAGISRFNGINFVNFTRANTAFISSERIRFMIRNKDNQIRAADMDGNVFAIAENQPTLLFNRETLAEGFANGWDSKLIGAGITDSFFNKGKIPSPGRIAFPFAQLIPLSTYTALLINPQGTVNKVDMSKKTVELIEEWGRDNLMGISINNDLYVQKRGEILLYLWNKHTHKLEKSKVKLPSSQAKIFWETGMSYPIAIDRNVAWALKSKNNQLEFVLICNEVPSIGVIKFVQYSEKKQLLFLGTTSRGFGVVRANRINQVKKYTAESDEATAYYSQWEVADGTVQTNEGHLLGKPLKKNSWIKGKIGFSIYEDGDSLIWFSTGLKKKPGSVLHKLNRKTGDRKIFERIDIVNVFAFAKWKNKIVIGNHRGLGLIEDDSLQIIFPIANPREVEATVYTLLEAEPGVFMMTTCAGWVRFNFNTKQSDTLLNLPGYCIRSQARIGEYIVIGTYGKGIYVYKNGKLKNIPLDKNSFLLYAHCFMLDKQGFVWISTNRGLFKALATDIIRAFEKENSPIYYHYFGKNDGMEMTELNGGCSPCALQLKNGIFSFPSMDGLVWAQPEATQPLMPEGPIYIDRITVDNVLTPKENLKHTALKHNFKSISVELGFAEWANSENIYLEHRISDTSSWIPLLINEESKVQYANTAPGNYTLQIRKRNGFGENNYYYLTIPFTVGRAWYDNSLFLILMLGVGIAIIYFFSNYQNRRLLVRQKELELVVQAKTQDLQEQYNVLEKSNRINNRLISIISHDIVTPLKFLTATGKGLYKKKVELPEETQNEILEEIINTSQELHLLSTNILNWIKYQSGNKRLRTENVQAQEIVQQVLSILNPLAKEKGIQLVNNILPTISFQQFAEPFKILVYNLVLNAIRYADKGEVFVEIQTNNNFFSLAVIDQGAGMSTAKIDSLLNDSSPIREKETDHKSGHGLGYLIIRDIVQWMDAQIKITSKLGKGTTVRVTFQSLKNQSVDNS
jgi:signal transduction histidine kinase